MMKVTMVMITVDINESEGDDGCSDGNDHAIESGLIMVVTMVTIMMMMTIMLKINAVVR